LERRGHFYFGLTRPIITHLLVAILLHTRLGAAGAQDMKALAKQEKRQQAKVDDPDGTDRPDWTVPLFRLPPR
jgi:cell division protein FtsB